MQSFDQDPSTPGNVGPGNVGPRIEGMAALNEAIEAAYVACGYAITAGTTGNPDVP